MAKRWEMNYGYDNEMREVESGEMASPTETFVLERDYKALESAARDVLEQMDLTCMRASEEISVSEGCPCPVCVLQRLTSDAAAEPPA